MLAYLSAMAGAEEDARTYLERSRRRHEELGLTLSRAHWTVLSGMALLYRGQLEAAEAELRWGYQTLRDIGERAALSTVAAYRASQIAGRGTRLPCRLAVGDTTGPWDLGRAALALAENTDDLELPGYAHAGLAAVLAAAGDAHAAAAETSAASSAYRAKGGAVSGPMLDVAPVAEVRSRTETLSKSG